MISQATSIWLGLVCLSVVGVGWSGLLVSREQHRQTKKVLRIQNISILYNTQRRADFRAFRAALTPNASLRKRIASVFGFDRSQVELSTAPWWLALIIAFVLARVSTSFVVDVVGSWGWMSMPVIWIGLSRSYFGWSQDRHDALLVRQFPDALAMIVRSLGVGVPVLGAIATVAREGVPPTSLEFARLVDELNIGVSLGQAVRSMSLRNGLSEYRFFATAVGLQAQTGGGLNETLENLALLINKRLALSERARALSSEARTSAFILGTLPIIMGLLLWLVNPDYIALLFTDSTGRSILGLAVAFLSFGALVMRVIIKRSLS